jgi:hypothetical protein
VPEARQDGPAQLKGTTMNTTIQEMLAAVGFAEETLADLVGLNAAHRDLSWPY